MVQYIYFVKCPDCEDEHFDYFDEAKEFAMSCLTKKPIITQIEVERNDFGECTDSCDLGTVWSWEDMMKDVPEEPEATVFSKSETFGVSEGLDDFDESDIDPQTDEFDDSAAFDPETYELSAEDDLGESCIRKPIPEGTTIESLVEEMEENEDEVECKWCNELFDKSECRYEVDLGYLCDRCQAAIKSRGETLTFREGLELDEKLDIDIDFSNCVDSSDMEIYGVEPIDENTYKAVLLKRFEDVRFRGGRDEIEKVEQEMFNLGGLFTFHFLKDGSPELGRWDPELLNSLGNCEILFDDERYDQACEKALNGSSSNTESLNEEAYGLVEDIQDLNSAESVEAITEILDFMGNEDFKKAAGTITDTLKTMPLDDETLQELTNIAEGISDSLSLMSDGAEIKNFGDFLEAVDYTEIIVQNPKAAKAIAVAALTAASKADPTGITAILTTIVKMMPAKIIANGAKTTVMGKLIKGLKKMNQAVTKESYNSDNFTRDLGNEFDGGYPTDKPLLPEFDDETPEVSDHQLALCPECGENTFDHETGICINCGFAV